MLTNTFTRTWSNSGEQISKAVSISSGAEISIDDSIAAAQTNKLVAFAADVSQMKGLYMVSSLDLAVETNSAGAPANTFTLSANVPYMWVFGDAAIRDTAGVAVITVITALYVTNPSAETAVALQIRMLIDPTL